MEDVLSPYITVVHQRLEASSGQQFGVGQLEKVIEWCGPLDTMVKMRALLGLHAADDSEMLSDACADAIAAVPDWRGVLSELFSSVPLTLSMARTAAKVVRKMVPDHPLGLIEPRWVTQVFDSIDDGKSMKARLSAVGMTPGPVLLLSAADPLSCYHRVTVTRDLDGLVIAIGSEPWLERHRLASPAYVLLGGDEFGERAA